MGTTDLDRARSPRRYPRWWGVLLIEVAGLYVAFIGFVVAALSLPSYGLFGEANDLGDRLLGTAAAVATGFGVVAGPLLVGAVRKDRRWLRGSFALAGAIATVIVACGLAS